MKRLNYYQVYKNKKPKQNKELLFITFEKQLNDLAIAANKMYLSFKSLTNITFDTKMVDGKVILSIDSGGGSV